MSVTDNGIGIAPEMLPRVFDMFAQAESALARSRGGLGIGLSLAKGLVEMHGGSIQARSEGPGRGSEFTIRLPTVPSPHQPADWSRGGAPAAPERRRILVADDNHDAARSLALLLRVMGHEVCTAADGRQALEQAAEFRPAIALLDIGMPNLNGYEAAQRLRQQPWANDIKLIALTGWGQPEDKRRALEAGFDAHIIKPVDFDKLQSLFGALLGEGQPAQNWHDQPPRRVSGTLG